MRIMIGLSGGVDSTVAAYLLKKNGHDVIGVHMLLNDGDLSDRAKTVADALDIEFYSIDFRNEFHKYVKEPFCDSYLKGETPNPCVICNYYLKFGELLKFADSMQCDKLATGHYVRSTVDSIEGYTYLSAGLDKNKDQSYFLWALSQRQLSRTLFPLGNYTKQQVRTIARSNNLPSAESSESQDICFIPDGDCLSFISRFTGKNANEGLFVDTSGTILGTHRGISAYTVGQRKGLGISAAYPLYVIKKEFSSNTVILGKEENLYYKDVYLEKLNIQLHKYKELTAKIRYSKNSAPVSLELTDTGAILHFKEPQRAPSPGQSAVLYSGDDLVGGGIIVSAK